MNPRKPAWIRQAMAAGGAFHAMKQAPLPHNLRNVGWAAALWSAAVGLVALGLVVPPAVHVLVVAPLLSCVFLGHFVLVIHECSHNMFVLMGDRKRQRALNRLIGRVAAGMFFTNYLVHWEEGHTIHHLRPCEPEDPQDRDPLTGRPLYLRYLLLCVPLSAVLMNPSNQYGFSLKRMLGGLAFWAPMLTAAVLLVSPWAALTLLMAFNGLMALNLTKKAQEHGGGLADEPLFELRSRTYLYPLAFLTSPFNINYHFEHHANFSVPWYLLPDYHRVLRDVVPADLQPHIFHGEFVRQLRGLKPRIPDALRPLVTA